MYNKLHSISTIVGSPGDVGELPVTWVKQCRKDWRMSYDVGEATEWLANEALVILKPFWHRLTYIAGTSPTHDININEISLFKKRLKLFLTEKCFYSVDGYLNYCT